MCDFMAENIVMQTTNTETHCAMCRLDFLGTGVCPSGKKYGYVAYWPQGRIEIYKALKAGTLKPTKKLFDIAETCTLCGTCDKQCSFITNRRPMIVQKALKEYVKELDKKSIQKTQSDNVLEELQKIVGKQWATNDPVILTAYNNTILSPKPSNHAYVVMPKTTKEVSLIIKLANANNLAYLPRGNGTFLSVAMQTLLAGPIGISKGIIIDMSRMNKITLNKDLTTATIQAGVTAFDLQKTATSKNKRILVGEAEAYLCANVLSFGIISTWGNAYGWGADNYTDVELVDANGNIIHHTGDTLINPYATNHGPTSLTLHPANIVTAITVKLHPKSTDEHAMLIPFDTLEDAVNFSLDLAQKNIGISLAILSSKYFSDFICPTNEIANSFEHIITKYFHINYLVDIICDSKDKTYVESHADFIIDEPMMKTFVLSTPKLASMKDSKFLKKITQKDNPLKTIFKGRMKRMVTKLALNPSAEQIGSAFDPDLKDFFTKLYKKPEMTNSIWLHEFRILPSRMLRQRMFMVRGGFMTAQKDIILKAHKILKEVGDKYHKDHALGFISYLDSGKIAFLEYDYYYDHTNPKEHQNLNPSIVESLTKELTIDGYLPIEFSFHKGLYRKEQVFYPFPKGLSTEELQQFGHMVQQIVGG
jgi:heterodisulfide reductase subunit C